MLTGSPLPELLPRGLVEQGRPALETLRLPFATSVVGVWRSTFAFVLAGGFRFYFAESAQKTLRLAFLIAHLFSFLFLLGSVAAEVRGRGSGVSGHIRYSGPEKICVDQRSEIISKFFTVHSTGLKCIGSIGDRRGRGREAKSGRPSAFSPGAPLIIIIISLSLSLSLSPTTDPRGYVEPPSCPSIIRCKEGRCRTLPTWERDLGT